MISLLTNINSKKSSNKIAVKLCNNLKILETRTFGEIFLASENFEKTLFSTLNGQVNLCIGLLMDKNVYLPSIILCLQKLNHAFVYLSKKQTTETAENLNVEYIVSLNITKICNFTRINEINMDGNKAFILWKYSKKCSPSYSFKDIFCIVQTSGTTGENKTIRITHNCIENNSVSLGKIFKITSKDVIFWGTPLSFDPSLIEFLLAWLNGASLIIVPDITYINPKSLFSALFNVNQVTVIQMVPSVFQRWDATSIEKIFCNPKLRILAFGGENFPKNILKYKRKEGLILFNLYGITEVSCWATVFQVNNKSVEADISIGKCLDETIVEVRSENGEILKQGEGEIYIGSNTRKCYIDDEFHFSSLPVFRKTGDLCCIKDGNIYYKGRKNKVIKRYGHRINITKIEEIVFNECHLTSKCVWTENQKLLMFILIKDNNSNDIRKKMLDKIRAKLVQILSPELLPDYFELLHAFPTTLHGKIDERKLQEYYLTDVSNTNLEATDIFFNLWCKYLGISTNNVEHIENYSFFEMGGNSISILQLISELKEMTNIESQELLAAVFEKKFYECKDLIAKGSFVKSTNKRIDDEIVSTETKVKKLKAEDKKMRILWKYDLKACVDGSPLVFTESTNHIRIAAGSFCNLFAILSENGEECFKDILTGSIESTPTISPCKNFLYIGCYDGTMHCINYSKKRTVWKFKTGGRIKCSALCVTDGAKIIFGSYDKFVYCLSSQEGLVIWKTQLNSNISANATYHEKFGVIIATTSGTCYCISDTKGEINWTYNCLTPIFGAPCIFPSKEQVVVPSVLGFLFCLNLKNGHLAWKFKAEGNIFSSVVKFKNFIVFNCHDKNIYVLKNKTGDFELVGKVLVNSEISSTPFVYETDNSARIVAATNIGTIYVINFENLSLIEEIKLPGEVFSSPFVDGNKIYVGCRDNNLYCLSLDSY